MSRLEKIGIVIVLSGLIAACASDQGKDPSADAPPPMAPEPTDVVVVPEEPVFEATPGLSTKERFRAAIRLLESGEAGQAEAELNAYLDEVPDSGLAKGLLEQIQTPIEDYFPEESFVVTLQAGDSLSTLAKDYLGDALKFYALSRFNALDNPSQVSAGQEIKIPSTESAIAFRDAPPPAEEPAEPEAVAEAAPEAAPEVTVADVPELAGWEKVNALVAEGDMVGAAAELGSVGAPSTPGEAKAAADIYMSGAKELGETDAAMAASYSQMAGALYLNQVDNAETAMKALSYSASLAPADTQTQELLTSAETAVIDKYYRSGLASYRQQDLDSAIADWDRVLDIDPEHTNASLYRAQAVELKEKLSNM